jgi:hypothetical protein
LCSRSYGLQAGGHGYLAIAMIMGAAADLVMNSIAQIKALYIRNMGDTSDQVVQLLEQGASILR